MKIMGFRMDLTGKRFGRLVVLAFSGNGQGSIRFWSCRCDCGSVCTKRQGHLRAGRTKSCGCLSTDLTRVRSFKHGYRGTRIYRAWAGMLGRCRNQNDKRYGGRGIKVSERWLKFENFLEDMGEAPTGKTIERKNNAGPYCKSNCCWATVKEQARNTSRNHFLTFDGETLCLAEWSERLGFLRSTIWARLMKYGWTVSDALTTPVRKKPNAS